MSPGDAARTSPFPGAVILLLVLHLPSVAGIAATMEIESARPVSLRGLVAVDAPGGTLHLESERSDGLVLYEGVTGTLTISTYRAATAAALTPMRVPVEPPRSEDVRLENATLRVALGSEPFYLTLAPDGALEARVVGQSTAVGLPVVLETATAREGLPSLPGLRMPPAAPWRWEAGWIYVGARTDAHPEGFPRLTQPILHVGGGFEASGEGGNLTVADASGERSYRLGRWREGDAAPHVQVVQSMYVRGTLARAQIPLEGRWGLAAPAMTWAVEGNATWHEATGTLRTPEGETTFRKERLETLGRFVIHPRETPRIATDVQPVRYNASGDYDVVRVGARALGSEPAPATRHAEAAAAISLLALLLALGAYAREAGWRAVGFLFTRLSREEILDHPVRRRLHDLVAAEPGLHLRELQRRLGCAWGPFTFHLQMLVQAGHLRAEKRGGYKCAFLRGDPGQEKALHALARRIHDAIPPDGTPVTLRRLREEVGVSHQLLAYHLRGLARRELVTLAQSNEGFGGKVVMRRR